MTGTSEEPSDDELLKGYANGDQSAARLLATRLMPRVHALAWRMLHDRVEAEDVTQEAMLRLWKIAPDWQEGNAKVSTWLHRVASNLCIDRLRRRRETRSPDQMPEVADETPGAVERLQTNERRSALLAALEKLPERQKLAITLRHFEEHGNPEIAEIMGTSVEAVESILARAKRSLSSRLEHRREQLGLEGDGR